MQKTQISEVIHLSLQTIPFLTITAIFVIIAYAYGNTITPPTVENAFEASKFAVSLSRA